MPDGLLKNSHAVTITAWVKLTASAAENRLFYFGALDAASYLTLTLNNSATTAGISLRFKGPMGSEVALTTPTQLPIGVWKHVAVTLSSAGAAIYIDGKVVAQNNALVIDPSTLDVTKSNLVGSSPSGQVFQGLIDEFYVYNYALPLSGSSPDDIRTLAWPKTDYSMYHLDEDTGITTVDSSDRHYDGTLVGNPTSVAGQIGKALNFSNNAGATPATQYVQLTSGIGTGNVASCSKTLTISAWINLTTNTTVAPFIEFAKDNLNYVSVTTYSTSTSYTGNVLSFNFGRGAATPNIVRKTGVQWALSTWTHVAIVRGWDNTLKVNTTDGAMTTVFKDDAGINSYTLNTGAIIKDSLGSATAATFDYLGRSFNTATAGFNGAIDEVLISCRAYTADEIAQLAYKP